MARGANHNPVNSASSPINFWQVLNTVAAALQKAVDSETAVYEAFRQQMLNQGLIGSVNWLDESGRSFVITALVLPDRLKRILKRFERLAGTSAEGFQFSIDCLPLLKQVLDTGEAAFLPDNGPLLMALAPESLRPYINQYLSVFGRKPGILAPMMVDGKGQGIMFLGEDQLSPADRMPVAALANHLAIAVQNARLFQRTRTAEKSLWEANQALHASHDLLHALVQQTPVGIQIFDTTGLCLDVNQAHLDIFGIEDPASIEGVYNIFEDPLAQHTGTQQAVRQALAGQSVHLGDLHFDFQHAVPQFAAQEGTRTINVTIFPVLNEQGEVLRVVGLNVDVTDRTRTEAALRHREGQLRLLAENIPGVIYQCRNNPTQDMLYLTDAVETLTGYPKELFLDGTISFRDLYHPDDLPKLDARHTETVRNLGVFHQIYRIRHRSGEWRWVEEFGGGVFDEDGQLLFLEGSITDITERKQAEMLQSTLYRIATVANADLALDQLYAAIHAILGDLMDVSNFYIGLYHDESGLMQLPYFVDEMDTFGGDLFPAEGSLTDYVVQTGQPQLLSRYDLKRLTRQGVLRPLGTVPEIWLGVPLRTQSNVFGAIVVQSYRDASAYTDREKQLLFFVSGQVAAAIERKRNEARFRRLAIEMEKQATMFAEILSTTPDHFIVFDLDGRVTYASPRFKETFQLSLSEMMGKTLRQLAFLPPDIIDSSEADLQKVARTGRTIRGEFHIPGRKGIRDLEYIFTPMKDAQGQVTAIVTIARDITERNKTKAALHQAQKMESLGILAGGVAHDFNNLLVGMMAQTSLALAKLPPDSPAVPHIQKATTASERAATLTNQLLAYSGQGQFTIETLNLNDLIQETLPLLKVTVASQIQLRLELAPSLAMIDADPDRIQQVLTNLVLNSSEAMHDQEGTITISTNMVSLAGTEEEYWQVTNHPLPSGVYVCLEIRDDGEGIDKEKLPRIFEPFFTTRFTGRGLGLAAVLGIVRGHHGGIHVRSRALDGTIVQIVLPISRTDAAPAGETTAVSSSSGLVLVIDDEAPVREAVADILTLEAIGCLLAEDGQSGLQIFQQYQADIELVLLDLSLPDMHGREVLNRLQKINPQIRVIISSGFSESEAMLNIDGTLVEFLPKPYQLDTLVNLVNKNLAFPAS